MFRLALIETRLIRRRQHLPARKLHFLEYSTFSLGNRKYAISLSETCLPGLAFYVILPLTSETNGHSLYEHVGDVGFI